MKQLLLFVVVWMATISTYSQNISKDNSLVVFLVRHAEKVDNSNNPALSEDGKERAELLAHTLASAGINYIHSTDYKRTKQTAQPLAKHLGCEVEIYDAKNLNAFAKELLHGSGRHLVVGHSNTTPQLVKLLGGEPGSKIDEKLEYDRLYIINVGKNEPGSTILIRYGKLYQKE